MGKNTDFFLVETGNHASHEKKRRRYTIIHKSLLSDRKDRSLHNFITKTSLYKNINESLTSVFTHDLYISKNKFLIA